MGQTDRTCDDNVTGTAANPFLQHTYQLEQQARRSILLARSANKGAHMKPLEEHHIDALLEFRKIHRKNELRRMTEEKMHVSGGHFETRFTVARQHLEEVINRVRPLVPSAVKKLEDALPRPEKVRIQECSRRRVWRGDLGLLMLACKSPRRDSEALPANHHSHWSPVNYGRPERIVRPSSAMMMVEVNPLQSEGERGMILSHDGETERLTYRRRSSAQRVTSRPVSSTLRETLFKCANNRSSRCPFLISAHEYLCTLYVFC